MAPPPMTETLPVNMQLVILVTPLFSIAPPRCDRVVLFVNVQLENAVLALPPHSTAPPPAFTEVSLLNVQLVYVTVSPSFITAPPLDIARLSRKLQEAMVVVTLPTLPLLYIPAPLTAT